MITEQMFHPIVQTWFARRFGRATQAQTEAWPLIEQGRDVLITAPTGSGKTLAAFLICLDRLVRRAVQGQLPNETAVVYVSPLKALSNDVRRNLEQPLAEMAKIAQELGQPLPAIRTATRTGDTSASERRALVKTPAHILVTTPESLYILLTSESGRKGLRTATTLVLDEIHAVVDDKRGAHLSLSVERLEELVSNASESPLSSLQRIGLSATVRPRELGARLLVGADRPPPELVDTTGPRDLDLLIEVPDDELGAASTNEQWGELYDKIAELAAQHRSTLVFVNTRRLVERLAHNLAARLGDDAVGAHHGSLSRERRFKTEQRLKSGDLKLAIATASLELGIDIGSVDLVCLVGSPRTIATGLQRIGRASHKVGGIPKARLFPLTRDQLIECAALVRAGRRAEIDRTVMRVAPLDILSQQIVAACACEQWDEDDLFALMRKAAPYADLSRDKFDQIVEMLSEGIATSRGRAGALLHRDAVNGRLRARRGARITALTSGGAIPDLALFDVVLEPEGTLIGTLDEDFAVESMAGDIILLGNTSWRVRRVENGKVRVEDAAGQPPSVPFWFGEGPARSIELSTEVGRLRQEVATRLDEAQAAGQDVKSARSACAGWLMQACALDAGGAELAVAYVAAGNAALGAVPSTKRVIAERFFDESGGTQLVVHAPFGGRINRAWGMALRKRFCRSFDFELQAAATDDGVLLSLGPQHSFPLEMILDMLHPEQVEELLTQAVLQAPLFETRWRWNASRALALKRHMGGKKVPPNLQRMRAQDLLAACFPQQVGCQDNHGGGPIEVPDHPLVHETVNDCLTEAMDAQGLVSVLNEMRAGAIKRTTRETPEPSVFAHEILNANPYAFLDDAPLEERRSRAVSVRRGLPSELAQSLGQIDPAAVETVVREAQPYIRNADELHDMLLDVCVWPEKTGQAQGYAQWFDELVAERRAGRLTLGVGAAWVAAERVPVARAVWPEAALSPAVDAPQTRRKPAWSNPSEALAEILRGHMAMAFPCTAEALAQKLSLESPDVESALALIESAGQVMRGQFTSTNDSRGEPDKRPEISTSGTRADQTQWFDRRLLARANRLTVKGLRQQIEPASAADYMRFLLRWQHLAPGSQLHGREGLLTVISQLQGYEAATAAWEGSLFPSRVVGYEPGWLDDLCISGSISWGRLSVRSDLRAAQQIERPPALKTGSPWEPDPPQRPATPTRSAPIALFCRKDLPWLLSEEQRARLNSISESDGETLTTLSPRARAVLGYLNRQGASFVDDLASELGVYRGEAEDVLRELVSAGWITADGFAGLRGLLPALGGTTKLGRWFGDRRTSTTRGASLPGHAAGRWSVFAAQARSRPQEPEARLEAIARQLITRYGIVFRDVLKRELQAPPWRELVRVYRSLEMRGEIRGGRMVAGFVGEQFAAPEALESLRALRRAQTPGSTPESVRISACDPLNLVGILTPGVRVPAQLGHSVVITNGVPESSESQQVHAAI